MITVEIIELGSHEDRLQKMVKWSALPAVGEQFSTGQGDYIVVERAWGVMCLGDGSPIWNDQRATLTVVKVPATEKDEH